MRRDVFQAIADPTRREILNMIAHRSLNVNSVAENFDVSRTAIYKHLKLLEECGMVTVKQKGRERMCEAKLDQLEKVSDWIEQYRQMWSSAIDLQETNQDMRQGKKEKKSKNGKKKKHDKKK